MYTACQETLEKTKVKVQRRCSMLDYDNKEDNYLDTVKLFKGFKTRHFHWIGNVQEPLIQKTTCFDACHRLENAEL